MARSRQPEEVHRDPKPAAADWPLAVRPGFLMRRLHQIHVALFMQDCAGFEITPLQYSILSALSDRGTADQTTLASAVALDRSTTTDILKRLQGRGLVTRSKSERDRRAQVARLTPAGHAMLARMDAAVRRAHSESVAPLSEAEQATLVALMHRIVDAHGVESADLVDVR